MNKTLIIAYCDDCPFFDNSYYDYTEICTENAAKAVPRGKGDEKYRNPIPDWCPLEEVTDVYKKK